MRAVARIGRLTGAAARSEKRIAISGIDQELTPLQTAALERLVARGFHLVAFPLYASAIGVRRESCAALVVPVDGGGLRLLGQPCYLIDGNLTVQIRRAGVRYFVWKSKSMEVTPDRLARLSQFADELQDALSAAL